MVKLPTREDLGGLPSTRALREPIARISRATPRSESVDTRAISQGVQDVGRGIGQVADAAFAFEDRRRKQVEFDTEVRFQQFEHQQKQAVNEAARNMQPGTGAAFPGSVDASHTEAGKAFLQTVPEELKNAYRIKLGVQNQSLVGAAQTVGRAEQKRFATNRVSELRDSVYFSRARTATTEELPEVLADFEDVVRANPDLTPIEADSIIQKSKDDLAIAHLDTLTPEEVITNLSADGEDSPFAVLSTKQKQAAIDAAENQIRKAQVDAEKRRQELVKIIAPTESRKKTDTIGILSKNSEEVAKNSLELAVALSSQEPNPVQAQSAIDKLLAAQDGAGVPRGFQKIFSNDQAKSMVRAVENEDPERGAALFLDWKSRFGGHWPRAYQELVEQGLSPDYAMIGVVSDSASDVEAVAEVVNLSEKENQLLSPVGTDARANEQEVLLQTSTRLVGVMEIYEFGADDATAGRALEKTIRKVALNRFQRTGDMKTSVDFAVGLLESRFEPVSNSNMRVLIPDETGVDEDTLLRATGRAQSREALEAFKPVVEDPSRPGFLNEEAAIANAEALGVWVTNPDGTGVILLHQFPGGGTIPVKNAEGRLYEILFRDMWIANRNVNLNLAIPTRTAISSVGAL